MVEPSTGAWPAQLPAVQVRFARPTAQLDRIVEFYRDVLHLPQLHSAGDDEWSVVMFGLPGDQYHLEFVAHRDGIDGTAPTRENLLVFYFESAAQQQSVAARCREAGAEEVVLDTRGGVATERTPSWTRTGGRSCSCRDRCRYRRRQLRLERAEPTSRAGR